jgi:hypothetical protein
MFQAASNFFTEELKILVYSGPLLSHGMYEFFFFIYCSMVFGPSTFWKFKDPSSAWKSGPIWSFAHF